MLIFASLEKMGVDDSKIQKRALISNYFMNLITTTLEHMRKQESNADK